MIVTINNPGFFRDNVSKEIPKGYEEVVRKAGQHIAEYVWETFARDAGINLINVSFIRLCRKDNLLFSHEARAQLCNVTVTRQQFEGRYPLKGAVSVSFEVDEHHNPSPACDRL